MNKDYENYNIKIVINLHEAITVRQNDEDFRGDDRECAKNEMDGKAMIIMQNTIAIPRKKPESR